MESAGSAALRSRDLQRFPGTGEKPKRPKKPKLAQTEPAGPQAGAVPNPAHIKCTRS